MVNVVALHRAELPDRILLPLLFVRSKIPLPVLSLCSQLFDNVSQILFTKAATVLQATQHRQQSPSTLKHSLKIAFRMVLLSPYMCQLCLARPLTPAVTLIPRG